MKKLLVTNFILSVMLFTGSIFSQQDVDKSFTVTVDDNLSLKTSMGNITIESWNKDKVKIEVKNILESEMSSLIIKQTGNNVEVRFKGDDSDDIEYYVMIPSRFNLELATGGGNINLKSNLDGKIDASTAGGNISTMNIDGIADISTAGGNIKVGDLNSNADISTAGGDLNIGNINGFADVSTAGGNINVGSVNNSADISTAGGNISVGNINGDADVSTAGGNISVEAVFGSADISTAGGNIKLSSANGKVEANTGAGNINLLNIKGSIDANSGAGNIYAELIPEGTIKSELNVGVGEITLKVPQNAAVTIIATIYPIQGSGDDSDLKNINSDFTVTKIDRSRGNRQIEVTYQLNGGGNIIELNTGLGNINIQKL